MNRTKYFVYSVVVLGLLLIAGGFFISPVASATTDTTVVEYDSLSPEAQEEFDQALNARPSLYVVNYHTDEFSAPAIAENRNELQDRDQRLLIVADGEYYELSIANVHEHPKIVLESEPIAYEDIPDDHEVKQIEEIDNHRTAYERAIETGYWEMHAHDTDGDSDGHGDGEHHHETRYIEYEDSYYEITQESKDGINGQALVIEDAEQPTYEAYAPVFSLVGGVVTSIGAFFWYRQRD